MAGKGLTIDRLHVSAHGAPAPGAGGAAGLRVAVEQALRQVRIPNVPPQTVLVIRTLASRTAFGAGGGAQQRWPRQIEGQLAELARQALRPDRQHVPAHAACVLFDDEVTLLACLTRDVLAGRWAWYWDELFPAAAQAARLGLGSQFAQNRSGCLLAAWLAYPQAVPHTLVSLQPPAAAAALRLLRTAELSQLAHSLHGTFALPRGALDAGSSAPSGLAPAPAPAPAPASGVPWREWLPPQQLRGLAPPAEYLLGLCYTLVHRPQEARGQEFGRQARHWLEDTTMARAAGPAPAPERMPTSDATEAPAWGQNHSFSSQAAATGDSAAGAPIGDSTNRALDTAEPLDGAVQAAVQESTTLETGVFTRLGGVIFFVNLMVLLGMPQSIPALARLNPWALLGALAAAFLGRRLPEYAADPLWAAVDELGKEETRRPWGASLAPGAVFRVPAAWGELLPSEQPVAYRDPAGGRLQVWAADGGYLLADLPPAVALAAAQAEWPALAEVVLPPADLEELPAAANQWLAPELAWWVQRLQPFLARWLARLTGLGSEAAAILFHQPGTLYGSRTHVDLVLAVDQISISLRRAGLDRTPGWRPEFGYIITVHFE